MKMIVVFDVPDDTEKRFGKGNWIIDGNYTSIVYIDDKGHEELDCHELTFGERFLKPIPDKRYRTYEGTYGEILCEWHYDKGWNDCVKEILGEKK